VSIDLNNLAQLLQATNRLEEAEPLSRRSVEILLRFGAATGHEHPHLRATIANHESLLTEGGLPSEQVAARMEEILSGHGRGAQGGR